MSLPTFFSRLWQGRLNRWEQSLVGGATGFGCGLLLLGAAILTSPVERGPNAPPIWEVVLIIGTIGTAFGAIIGASADVYRPAARRHGADLERGEERGMDAHAASPAMAASHMHWRKILREANASKPTNKPTAGGLSIRLVPGPTHDAWEVAFRNDGSTTLS